MEPGNTETSYADRQNKVGDPNDNNPNRGIGSGVEREGARSIIGERERQDIDQRFTPRPLTGDARNTHQQIMFSAKDLAEFVVERLPNNRERALALTKLEEFGHWCEKSLIHPAG